MNELIPINIVIGDRSYRIKVSSNDEEVVRKTIKIINDKLVEFKTEFAGKDMQDYVSMVILWYATQQQNGKQMADKEGIVETMDRLESLLDKALI